MQIVPFAPSDAAYRQRVALLKEAQPEEPWSLEGERAADAAATAAGHAVGAFVALAGGEAVGFARAQADADVPVAGRRRLWVVVAHRARRRGIGTALLESVTQEAAAGGATEWHVSTSLAEPDGLAFALARGFREVEAEHELHLDLGSVAAEAAPAPGPVASLAARQRADPDWFERYYCLHTTVEANVPWGLGYAVPDRQAFRRRHVDAEEALHEGTTIALAGGEWVGLCEMWRSGDDAYTVYQELTGVLAAQQGRGWGRALVTAAALWARQQGYRRMFTSTSTSNGPMQALASRLGFRVGARWVHLLGPAAPRRVPSGREVGS
ncbi:MAG: GNAT family N-acetyltransferase [Acidimicrobiia bacterium]|nr:GNAT family N-acetyltransferase [Acidimicrobiia bacterium]